tara:strand:- start:7289 stop:9658 length:2370 start_codon:yes stop_codon:yes gene_type:complete
MKNKFLINLFLIILFYQNILFAEIFNIESSEIKILEKGKITKATNGVKILSNDGIEIIANDIIYNKQKSVLKVFGNVTINDKKNNILTEGEEYIYFKNEEKILSIGKSKSNLKNTYKLESEDLVYNRNLSEVYSDKNTKIEDSNNNIFFTEQFNFNLNTSLLKAKNLSLFDNKKNQYYLNFALVNLNDNKFLGSDITIDFDNSLFGNEKNEPRLKGNSLISEKNNTTIYKGSFTTCNQKDNKCPPWSIYAEEVVHKKNEKKIEYKNAWLKIYDKPVVYFPYFFHPDPSVKRQSGFLMPGFKSSNNSGISVQIPYYKVISDRKDLTLTPRIFFDNEIFLQTEYRQANKDSDLLLDFSVNKDSNDTKNHFFVDLSSNKQNHTLDLHLERVSNDTYLKKNNITSPIIDDISSLHSYINYYSFNEASTFELNFEVFENLDKPKNDRFEYIFPRFNYEKYLYNNSDINGDLSLNLKGFQKNYNSSSDEIILINDLLYSSYSKTSSTFDGLVTDYQLLLRNVNTNSENSDKFKEGNDQKLLSTFIFGTKFPLQKKKQNSVKLLTPKISARYSPNLTKNNRIWSESINYNNIFSLDRIDDTAVEGGGSLTLGVEYSSSSKNERSFGLSFANILRIKDNPDLPEVYGFSEKRSDFIGEINYFPSKFFDLNYQFSLDKDLNESNYNLIKTNININNFVTSFEFLEEDKYLSKSRYVKNETKFNFDNNNSISFGTSKNLDQNITNYYNLIYEYENDCLTAAIEYNKNYYTDGDLKPEENILFSIKIIPFGKISTPSLTK